VKKVGSFFVLFLVLFCAQALLRSVPKGTASVALSAPAVSVSPLINALMLVESGGGDGWIGDKSKVQKAYGCLQIRQPVVDDYNCWCKTSYRAEDCLNNRGLSVKICQVYLDHYAAICRLGHEPTDEDRARIWNGGPNGWRHSSTDSYWEKVRKHL
jgi:hypothetical protein